MKSKITWCILIFLVLFNFIFTGFVYADDDEMDLDLYEDMENGSAIVTDSSGNEIEREFSSSTSQAAGATGLIVNVTNSIVSVVLGTITSLVVDGGLYRTSGNYSTENVGYFTVGSLIFGEYLMFDINLTQTNADLNPDIEGTAVSNGIDALKNGVLGIYRIVNGICMIVFFILAMYTWIRVFMANTAEDKARFKKAANAWIQAIIFLALVLVIISAINRLMDIIMDVLYDMKLSMEEAGFAGFESILFKNSYDGTVNYSGFKALLYFIELMLFVILDIWFLAKYFKRSFMIFVLVVLAPVFAIMDIFRKLNNRSGMLNKWFSSYLSYVFIQPFHALMYLVFMMVGSNIVLNVPLVGILLLYALLMAEKIAKIMLDFGKDTVGSLFARNPENVAQKGV